MRLELISMQLELISTRLELFSTRLELIRVFLRGVPRKTVVSRKTTRNEARQKSSVVHFPTATEKTPRFPGFRLKQSAYAGSKSSIFKSSIFQSLSLQSLSLQSLSLQSLSLQSLSLSIFQSSIFKSSGGPGACPNSGLKLLTWQPELAAL